MGPSQGKPVSRIIVWWRGAWVLSQAVGFRVTRGVLASAQRLPASNPADLLATARRVVVLEELNDFENLGAIFRNAAAFGVTLRVTPFYVFLSVFVSGAVGVASGWYPASRASKLDPIVALRCE